MQQVRLWHWISSALCLTALLLFAATGVTLNHAADIKAAPKVVSAKAQMPASELARLKTAPSQGQTPLPEATRAWIKGALKVEVGDHKAEWSDDDAYVALPRPGGDAWLSIDRQTGAVEYEKTTRGMIAFLDDLHKGRNTGPVWGWFIDIFAGSCLVFALSGLFLLQFHAKMRPITWPLVGAGLAILLLLALLFLHF